MPNVKSTRYYENFDIPPTPVQPQATATQSAAEAFSVNSAVQPQSYSASETNEYTQPQNKQLVTLEEQAEAASSAQNEHISPNSESEPYELSSSEPSDLSKTPIHNTPNNKFAAEEGQGEISVQALTARGTRPVSEAAVIIYKNRDGKDNVVSFYLTGEDGRTTNIAVPAPLKSNSQSPSDTLPFADYNIAVRHPMYYTVMIDNVQVFGDELTIQTVELIPLPEFVNELNTTKTVVIPKQNL